MSNFYSVISFLAFFFLATLILDISMPRKQVLSSVPNNFPIAALIDENNPSSINQEVIVIKECTPILHQTISITRLVNSQIRNESKASFLYYPGFIFIIFLIIGSIYGVFMKKPPYLERRAAYYNIIVGSSLIMLLIASFF
jgi:hypothetical protein